MVTAARDLAISDPSANAACHSAVHEQEAHDRRTRIPTPKHPVVESRVFC